MSALFLGIFDLMFYYCIVYSVKYLSDSKSALQLKHYDYRRLSQASNEPGGGVGYEGVVINLSAGGTYLDAGCVLDLHGYLLAVDLHLS